MEHFFTYNLINLKKMQLCVKNIQNTIDCKP